MWPWDEAALCDGRSWSSVIHRIVATIWWSSDCTWRVRMRPYNVDEEEHRFTVSIGSSSSGFDLIQGPSGALNMDRYNSCDRWSRSTHLSEFFKHVRWSRLGGPHIQWIDARCWTLSPSDDPRCATQPECHVGTCAGPRGRATWPCVPRRIHVGPRDKYPLFTFILNILND